jgi:hypothetical protein
MEETSLTDFLGEDEGEAGEGSAESSTAPGQRGEADATPTTSEADPSPEEGGGSQPSAGDDAVDPATPTAAWSPDGAPCEECGDPATWRWRDAGEMVCEGCTSW